MTTTGFDALEGFGVCLEVLAKFITLADDLIVEATIFISYLRELLESSNLLHRSHLQLAGNFSLAVCIFTWSLQVISKMPSTSMRY